MHDTLSMKIKIAKGTASCMLEAETYLPKGGSHIETEINLYSGRC